MASTAQTTPATAIEPATETVVVEAPAQQTTTTPPTETVVETVNEAPSGQAQKLEPAPQDVEALYRSQASKHRSRKRVLLGCCLGTLIGAAIAALMTWIVMRRWAKYYADGPCNQRACIRQGMGENWRMEPNFTCIGNVTTLEGEIYKAMDKNNLSNLAVVVTRDDCTYAKAFSDPTHHLPPLEDEGNGAVIFIEPTKALSSITITNSGPVSTVTSVVTKIFTPDPVVTVLPIPSPFSVPGPISYLTSTFTPKSVTSVITVASLIPVPGPVSTKITSIPVPVTLPAETSILPIQVPAAVITSVVKAQDINPVLQNTPVLIPVQAQNIPNGIDQLPTAVVPAFIAQVPGTPPNLRQDRKVRATSDDAQITAGGSEEWQPMKHFFNKDKDLSISIVTKSGSHSDAAMDEIAMVISKELAETDELKQRDHGAKPVFEKDLDGSYFTRTGSPFVKWLNITDHNDLPGLKKDQKGWLGYGMQSSNPRKQEFLTIVHVAKDVYLGVPAESNNTELVDSGKSFKLLQKFRYQADPTNLHRIDGFALTDSNTNKRTLHYSLDSFKEWFYRQNSFGGMKNPERFQKDFLQLTNWTPLFEQFSETGRLPTSKYESKTINGSDKMRNRLRNMISQLGYRRQNLHLRKSNQDSPAESEMNISHTFESHMISILVDLWRNVLASFLIIFSLPKPIPEIFLHALSGELSKNWTTESIAETASPHSSLSDIFFPGPFIPTDSSVIFSEVTVIPIIPSSEENTMEEAPLESAPEEPASGEESASGEEPTSGEEETSE